MIVRIMVLIFGYGGVASFLVCMTGVAMVLAPPIEKQLQISVRYELGSTLVLCGAVGFYICLIMWSLFLGMTYSRREHISLAAAE